MKEADVKGKLTTHRDAIEYMMQRLGYQKIII